MTARLTIAALVLSLAGCSAGPEAVPIHEVEAERFDVRVPGRGELEAAKATPVQVPVNLRGSQRIAWIRRNGETVGEGDVLVELDGSAMRRQETRVERALTRIDRELEAKEKALEKERIAVETELALLERQRADAVKYAPRDPELFSRHEILDAEADIKLLDTRIDHAKEGFERTKKRSEAEMEILRLQRRTEELRLEQTRDALASLRIRAPHDGTFLRARRWNGERLRTGENVWRGMRLGELPDPSTMKAKVHVLEAEAAGLEEGQRVELDLEGHPGSRYAGNVSGLQPIANPIDRESPVRYFELEVELDETDTERMRPAGEVRVVVLAFSAEEVLTVPNQAIFRDDEAAYVFVRNGAGFERRTVTLGARSLSRTVVSEGLTAGDEVALTDPEDA